MKTRITLLTTLLFVIQTFAQTKNQKEILLVGTMHVVPKIVKHSYKPMLKKAIKYNPDAILVESPQGNDTLSWEYLKNGWSKNYQRFYRLSDSIKEEFQTDEERVSRILEKEFKSMSDNDLDYLIKTFTYRRDHANYEFYKYIKQYGTEGSKKPTRHEDGDLTFKLALSENIKLLKSMDDQRTNREYHEAWRKCAEEGQNNGNNAANSKLYKKNYNRSILPAIFRGLGKHSNKRKTLQQNHDMASFKYVKVNTPGCNDGLKYWNQRDARMAKNIAEHILNSDKKKNIVIVGASHIIGLERELKNHYPELKVVLWNEWK
ncbi:MAG: DUF5694 domain-containing protein [Bacteroidota bacterium]